jgi:hypothetical protein
MIVKTMTLWTPSPISNLSGVRTSIPTPSTPGIIFSVSDLDYKNTQDPMTLQVGTGQIRIKFRMPKDPRQEMFDIRQVFLSIEDAIKYIERNADWLTEASIVRVNEYTVATFVNGKKVG